MLKILVSGLLLVCSCAVADAYEQASVGSARAASPGVAIDTTHVVTMAASAYVGPGTRAFNPVRVILNGGAALHMPLPVQAPARLHRVVMSAYGDGTPLGQADVTATSPTGEQLSLGVIGGVAPGPGWSEIQIDTTGLDLDPGWALGLLVQTSSGGLQLGNVRVEFSDPPIYNAAGGERTIDVPAAAGHALDGGPTFSGTWWNATGTTSYLYFPVTLPAGSVVSSWSVRAFKGSQFGALSAEFAYEADGDTTTIGQPAVAAGSGLVTFGGSVDHVIGTGRSYFVRVSGSGGNAQNADLFYRLRITYRDPMGE